MTSKTDPLLREVHKILDLVHIVYFDDDGNKFLVNHNKFDHVPAHSKLLTRLFIEKMGVNGLPDFLLIGVIAEGATSAEVDGMIFRGSYYEDNGMLCQIWINNDYNNNVSVKIPPPRNPDSPYLDSKYKVKKVVESKITNPSIKRDRRRYYF